VGDAAIASMAAESMGTYRRKPMSEKSWGVGQFLKRDGRWQAVSSRMTAIKKQAAANTPGATDGTLNLNVGGGTATRCTAPAVDWSASS
jgi:hypothetical protein